MGAKAKKNPLYVVTNDGKDVEQAEGFFDAIIKKFGLEPFIQVFNSILSLLSDQVGNYGFFLFLQEFVDQVVENLEELKGRIGSIVPIFS
ncbi:hypothetical protein [Bacteriovorax sp. DB6_IX]|uniref:hypothetical protein n=1 Tax=Bacteriovorax sp. DB6_IX TaxID=1353530 RepID=UPI00038A3BA1|nr:hypothetical protein [Bacteriovorax sp. DB6_IX]EQC50892.1 hypothetical protein M901_2565 [Bacteriovorax sp. DB6_IX]